MTGTPEMDEGRRRYEFKKTLEKLMAKQGSGTELISLYIPPDKQIHDVTAQLRDEFGQCANIKSKQTRTNVQSAISSILSRLKYYKNPPLHGMAVFCGTIQLQGDRTDLGVTGESGTTGGSPKEYIDRIRSHTSLPLALGFGVGTPEKAALAAEAADGVVVGSALISLLEPCGSDRELLRSKAVPFLRSLREAVGRTRR